MITEHIELPDPATHMSKDIAFYFDGVKQRIVVYSFADRHGDDPKLLERVDTPDEADRIVKELRLRLNVARALLGLK